MTYKAQVGDALFVTSKDIVATVIKHYTIKDAPPCIFKSSHVELVVYIDDEGPVTLSAEPSGLECRYMLKRMDPPKHSGEVWRYPLITPYQAGRMTQLGLRYSFKKNKYDWLGLTHFVWWLQYPFKNDQERFFCSENVATILQELNMMYPRDPGTLSPIGLNYMLKMSKWEMVYKY